MKNTNATKDYMVTTKVYKCNGRKFKGYSYHVEITDGKLTASFITHGANKLDFAMFASGENALKNEFFRDGNLLRLNSHKGTRTRNGLEAQRKEMMDFVNSILNAGIDINYTDGEGVLAYSA